MVRLQKFLAEAGVASRRASEELIRAGRVCVNGRTAQAVGIRVDPDQDRISVNGKQVRPRKKLYVALNKPRKFVCTRSDDRGRPTVYDLLPAEWRHLFTVGRLDYDSEGLLFLTNDGDFSLHLTHPRFEVRKKYLATVNGRVDKALRERLLHGVTEGGERLHARSVRVHHSGSSGSLVELDLTEGRNREVRRMFTALGQRVKRLQRIQIGGVKLGELRSGRWRTLTEREIKTLLNRL